MGKGRHGLIAGSCALALAGAANADQAPAPETPPAQAAQPATEVIPTAPVSPAPAAEHLVLIRIAPAYREAVRGAAEQCTPPVRVTFDGPSDAAELVVALEFTAAVDRTRQRTNEGGAVAGGPATMVLGAIVPWACPTTYTLTGVVSDRQGNQVGEYTRSETKKRVGTMLFCRDPGTPDAALAGRLIRGVVCAVAADDAVARPPSR